MNHSRILALAGVLFLLGLSVTSTAHAHEKWFLSGELPEMGARGYLTSYCAAGAAVAILVTLAAGYIFFRRGGRDVLPGPEKLGATPEGLTRFYAWVPLILGVHFAVPLLVLGVQGKLFSPNNQLPAPWSFFLGTWEIAIALSLLYGGLTRLFSVALAVLWFVAGFGLGWEIAFENLHYLGAAAFFFCAGRGPYSIDRLLFPALEPKPQLTLRAMPVLRVCFGLSLVIVALTEKLANPDLALAFLGQYQLNFTHALGLPLSDRSFIWCAGTVELLIGLFLAFGVFPRLIIVAAWGIINLTLTIFSWVELVGHLPIYGIMAVFLIWEPTEKTQLAWQQGILGRKPAA